MSWLERAWYGKTAWLAPLLPVEALFKWLATKRRKAYRNGDKSRWRAPVPVVVVGNISVGGTGKTPLTIWLVEQLRAAGYRPGVISRGYGGKAPHYPYAVTPDSPVAYSGDEPLMLVKRCACPLVVDPDRGRAGRYLLEHFDCDLILSDDGLQHYALARDIEIAVVDGIRGLGNGHCFPVGPLREAPERLSEVDFCVINGQGWSFNGGVVMTLDVAPFRSLDGEAAELPPGPVNGVAGIGRPQRFFDTLARLGYDVDPYPKSDHHVFSEADLVFDNNHAVVMTEKDAVKCRAFAAHNRYYLPINAALPEHFLTALLQRLAAAKDRLRN